MVKCGELLIISMSILGTTGTSLSEENNCQHDESTFRCVRYLGNYDGDTATFSIPGVHPLLGEKIGVRVRGVDTPEINGKTPCEGERAIEARDLVKKIIEQGKRVDLAEIGRDKYFRIVANIVVDGVPLKDKLLSRGLAYEYDGGKKANINWCQYGSGTRVIKSTNKGRELK